MNDAAMLSAKRREAFGRLISSLGLVGDCWEFQGCRDDEGYGSLSVAGRLMRAHRFMAQMVISDIPPGMVVMHSCDRPPCCNPSHLSIGTHADNHRDRQSKGRTRGLQPGAGGRLNALKGTCPQGHPYSGSNLRVDRRGYRSCRECERVNNRASRIRRREALAQRDLRPEDRAA